MGLVNSSVKGDGEYEREVSQHEAADERQHRIHDQRMVKLLLYGPGECGKTTILRKMMLIYGNNLDQDRKKYRPNICFNVIEGASITLLAAKVKYNIDFGVADTKVRLELPNMRPIEYIVTSEDVHYCQIIQHAAKYFKKESIMNCSLNPNPDFNPNESLKAGMMPDGPTVVSAVRHFYEENPVFRGILTRRGMYGLFENWVYFAEKLRNYPTWGGEAWEPNQEDLLQSRMRTTGLNEFLFTLGKDKYRLTDVGGQRQERSKFFWLFQNMDCVLFVGSLADYCSTLYEDPSQLRLIETLRVWNETVNKEVFDNTWIVLFLNKYDLFKKMFFEERRPIPRFGYKIDPPLPPLLPGESPVEGCMYEQEEDCPMAIQWFEEMFKNQVHAARRNRVRVYCTSALEDDGRHSIDKIMKYTVTFLQQKIIEGV